MSLNILRAAQSCQIRGIHLGQNKCISDKKMDHPNERQARALPKSEITAYLYKNGVFKSSYDFSRALKVGRRTLINHLEAGRFEKLDALIERYKREQEIKIIQ